VDIKNSIDIDYIEDGIVAKALVKDLL